MRIGAPARFCGRWSARLVHGLLRLAFMVAVVVVALLGGLAWRLAAGPLDVTPLAQRVMLRFAPSVTADHVTVAWDGLRGHEHALHIDTAGLRLTGPGGQTEATAAQAGVALSASRLLFGQVAPRAVTVSGLRLHATRGADGQVTLAGAPPASGTGTPPALADIAQPPRIEGSALSELTRITISYAQIDVDDQALGHSWTVGALAADLTRAPEGGLTGHAGAAMTLGTLTSHATLDASLEAGAAATRLRVSLSPLSPAALARLVPELKPLSQFDAPVGLTAEAELNSKLGLRTASLHAEVGPGIALLPAWHGGTSPGSFTSMTLDASATANALTVQALRVVLTPPSGAAPTTITLSGNAQRGGGRVVAHLRAEIDHATFADLPSLWPDRVGGGARSWVVENIDAGTAHDGRFDLTLEGPDDLSDMALTAATGSITGDDVELYWLRPVPPIQHAHAVLQMLDPDTILISMSSGRQGNLVLQPSTMRIWGLSTPHQFGLITSDIAAPIADVFTLLRHPRLQLLSRHPLPITSATGTSLTHLTVRIPLEAKVQVDDIAIRAQSALSNVRVIGAVDGKNLEDGTLALDVTNDGLTLTGTARLVGMPSTLAVNMDFRAGPPSQVLLHAAVTAQADAKGLAAAGLDMRGTVVGSASAKVDYAERRDAQATVLLDADLHNTGITTPVGWSKTVGTAGRLQARALLNRSRLVGIEDLRAEAPGLSVAGRSEMIDGRPALLQIDRGVVGRSDVAGTVRFPLREGEPLQVSLSGARLDLSSQIDDAGSDGAMSRVTSGRSAGGPPYTVSLRFGQVLVARGGSLGAVSLDVTGRGRRISQAQLSSSGPEQVRASVVPDKTARKVSVATADLGRLLRDFGLARALEGGQLALSGSFDDRQPSEPFVGTLSLSHFRVRGAPCVGKLLQALTLYGLVDALRGPGLVFDQLSTPFSIAGSVISVQHALTFSSSLGMTAQGWLDFSRQTMDMRGTIVPAYFFNTLPGRVPLIGRLFSPERGGGVFAATYSLRGPIDSPTVGVNPLATFAPGMMRGLFGLFN